jgi:predicted transcriptional regulator of viral defense system
MEDSLSGKIRQRIKRGKSGKIYFAKDFSDIGNDELINKALFRLEKNKTLVRLSHGIYLYPFIDKELGIMLPAPETVAKAIAKRDNARILPSGNHAMNLLGLSTQVPMNVVYMTDGSPRKVSIGKRKITFKKTSPRNFGYKGKIIPLVVGALREIGEGNINAEQSRQLESVLLHSEEKKILLNDANLAPSWIKKVILPIINKLDE